jgi:hypothetical protein
VRSWRPSRSDVMLHVALVCVILPTGMFLVSRRTPLNGSVRDNVVNLILALVSGGLICRYITGLMIPPKLTEGGPGNRALFYWGPYLCVLTSLAMWYPEYKYYLGPGVAAGFTSATIFRCVRRWQATQATPKEERDASLPPEPVYSRFSLVGKTVTDLGLSIIGIELALITGSLLSDILKPVVEGVAAPLPGGHLRIAGHLAIAYVVVSLCGLAYTVIVTNHFLRALTMGMRDWKMARVAQYFWACIPYGIALGWWVRQSGLAFGCAITLVLLIALGIWTDSPPEVAFSKVKAASVLWRSHLRHGLQYRSRTEPSRPDPASATAAPRSMPDKELPRL